MTKKKPLIAPKFCYWCFVYKKVKKKAFTNTRAYALKRSLCLKMIKSKNLLFEKVDDELNGGLL